MKEQHRIVDAHVHLENIEDLSNLQLICSSTGTERMNLLGLMGFEYNMSNNPHILKAKAACPDKFYAFPSLDHANYWISGYSGAPSLAEQVDRLISMGADGVKMLENKPTARKELDIPIDGPYFAEYFARLEETGFPVMWHVADPEEFWDEDRIPVWAKEQGWGYDDTFVPSEQLYAEVENVLARHPGLNIIFAHFFFLSADLPRVSALLDKYKGVNIDLTPGIELFYNLSKAPATTRDFVETYADRIFYGTDIFGAYPVEQAKIRSEIVLRWLCSEDEFRVPENADFLLGPSTDGIIRGLDISDKAVDKICAGNFERFVGSTPKALNTKLADEEIERITREAAFLKDIYRTDLRRVDQCQ